MGHEPRWDIRGQQCCRLRMMEDKNEEHNHTSPFAPPGYSFTCAFVRKQKQNGPRINPGLILLLFLLIFTHWRSTHQSEHSFHCILLISAPISMSWCTHIHVYSHTHVYVHAHSYATLFLRFLVLTPDHLPRHLSA